MAKFYLLGGRSLETTSKKLYSFLESTTKGILFFGNANENTNKSYNNFMALLSEKTVVTNVSDEMLSDSKLIKNLLDRHDIFFFAGGHSNKLISLLGKNNIDSLLRDKLAENVMFCGISAGAIMLCEYGMGDGVSYYDNFAYHNFQMVKGFGLLKATYCPHYQRDGLVLFDDEAKKYPFNALALEDDTAILIDGGRIIVMKDNPRNSVYLMRKDNDFLLEPIYEQNIYEWND